MQKPIEPNTEIPVTVTSVDMANGTITFELPEEYGAASVQHHVLGMSTAAEPHQPYAERSFIDADGDRYMVDQSVSGHNTVLTYENAEGGGMSMFIFKTEDADRIIGLVETAKGWAKK